MIDFSLNPPRIFFFLGGALFKENLLLAKEIRERHPQAHLSAFICGRRHLLEAVQALDNTPSAFDNYQWLNSLITQWLSTPLDRNKLAEYEKLFGTDTLRRLITADRELGYGLVTGGIVEKTKLINATKDNDDVRWRYIVGLLDYLFNTMQEQKPDMVFLYGIAGADAMAMSLVAHHLGIPAPQMIFSRIGDWHLLDDDTMGMLREVKDLYQQALANPALVEKALPEASAYFDNFVNRPFNTTDMLVWTKKLLRENSFAGIIRTLAIDAARWIAISLGLQGSRGNWRQRHGSSIFWISLRRFITMQYFLRRKQASLEEIVGDTPFIYYPLHVDPEMTTMILGDKLTNQVATIEAISKQMPAGYKLVVKEHIPMLGKRPPGYYKSIQRLPDVHLVSPFENNFKIIQRAALTITVTGTSAWENMMLGRVPVILGQVHFLNMGEGFVHAPELANLSEKIRQAMTAKPIPAERMKLYIASMIENAFEFSIGYIWFNTPTDEKIIHQSLSDIVDRFETYIRKKRAT